MSSSLLASPSRRAAQARLVPSPARLAAQQQQQSHTPHAASATAASAAAPADRTIALESRLQQTNARIGQLLDQMSWREEEASRSRGADSGDREAEAAPSSPVAAAAASASASPASAASLLSTCRPFDRSAFLARVATFSPLVWMHRAQTGTALSPLLLARFGWIAAPPTADGRIAPDTVVCPLCAVEVTLHFAPEVLALSDGAPIRALARKYASQVIPSAHAANCAWNLAQADVDFTRIVPGGVARAGEVSANRRAVVLGQAEQRALALTKRVPPQFWRSFNVAASFVEAARELLLARSSPVSPSVDPLANLDLTMLLALCGWEIRSPSAAAPEAPAAFAAPAPPAVLQCCFGCREVGALERFCSEPSEAEIAAAASATAATEGDDGEDEERSALQSPIKRRRTDTSKVMSRSSSSVAPAAPVMRIRPSASGFHAAREHRPFCPFVQPIADRDEDADAAALAAASSSSASSPPSIVEQQQQQQQQQQSQSSTSSSDSESPPLGWQQVLLWFHERTQSKAALAEQMQQGEEESEAALADMGTAAASSLPHKERQFQSAITTVRKLLQAHAK